jgi:mannose-6-phosphate isomerase-like protein (cupin superfamily)
MKRTRTILFISILFIYRAGTLELVAQMKPENVNAIDSTKHKYTLDNCINQFSMDKTVKTDAGYQYWFVDKDFADGKTLKMSVVAPHSATHAPHVHTEDEFFFILEGNAEVYLIDKWKSIPPNTSFYCPSNVEHGIRNSGEKELKYLVIKKYEKK